jgi:hypothetical protein
MGPGHRYWLIFSVVLLSALGFFYNANRTFPDNLTQQKVEWLWFPGKCEVFFNRESLFVFLDLFE